MDRPMVAIIILLILLEIFFIYLFVKYKKGEIDQNPFITLFSKESTIIFYTFFRWKVNQNAREDSFSLHKNSTYFWLFIALLHEQIIEMLVFHFYFKKIEPSYAYFMSALHVYSIFYIIGDYNWVRNTPIRIKNNMVEMKIGARRQISFHVEDVKLIQEAALTYGKRGEILHEKDVFHATAFPRFLTRAFGISDELKHEIIFKKPITSKGYFGLKKKANKVLVYIEESELLVSRIEAIMGDSLEIGMK